MGDYNLYNKLCRVCLLPEGIISIDSLMKVHDAKSKDLRKFSTFVNKLDCNGNAVGYQEMVCQKDLERMITALDLFEQISEAEEFYFKSIRDGTSANILREEVNFGFNVCRSCLSPEPVDCLSNRNIKFLGLKSSNCNSSEALLICELCLKHTKTTRELIADVESSEKLYYEARLVEDRMEAFVKRKRSSKIETKKITGTGRLPAALEKPKSDQGDERLAVARNGFRCEVCGKSSPTKATLKIHLEGVHAKIKKFACDLCPKMYYQRKEIQSHIERNHLKKRQVFNSSRPFRCTEAGCNKFFKTKPALKIHLKSHSDERPFVCWCKKAFKYKNDLKLHQMLHEKKKQIARSNAADGMRDLSIAGTSREADNQQLIKGYPCSTCNRLLATKPALQLHIDAVHLKIKKFSCEICSKNFSQKGSLKTHVLGVHSM